MKKKPSKYLIYGLVDPITDELRYIGRSSSGLARPRQHHQPSMLRKSDQGYCGNWVRTLITQNLKPEIIIIEEFQGNIQLNDAEEFWIAYYKGLGCRLTNLTVGGAGANGFVNLNNRKPFYEVESQREYQTLQEAADDLSLEITSINKVLLKKQDHTEGFVFRYLDEPIGRLWTPQIKPNSRDIIEINSKKIFKTANDAAFFFGLVTHQVRSNLNKNIRYSNYTFFMYLDDYNSNKFAEPKKSKPARPVKELTTGKIFNKRSEAARHFGISTSIIVDAIKKDRICKGLKFVYV